MNNQDIKNQFLTYFNSDKLLQESLERKVNIFKNLLKKDDRGENFKDGALLTFLAINELIIRKVEGLDIWEKEEHIFNRTMKDSSTANLRPALEANVINKFQVLGEFGYGLIVKEKYVAGDEFQKLWKGVKAVYQEFW